MEKYKVVELKDSELLGKVFNVGVNNIYPTATVVKVMHCEAFGTSVDVQFEDGHTNHGVSMDIINLQNK